MAHLYLGLAFHNHQPVGNYGFVFDDVYRKSYLPLIEALERHPGVRVSLHYSGPLLDWLFEHRPTYVERVVALAARGQVEMMTGAYYEPILPMIPEADRVGQIGKMNHTIRTRFQQEPTGMWLAERVWEPDLPASLAKMGVRWTILDDSHFTRAGVHTSELRGAFVTEHQGERVKVYGSLLTLRYLIPWRPVEEVMGYLRSQADEEPGTILVFGDDGEKFGSWPDTYRYVWEEGWLDRFFSAVESAGDWLTTIPVGEHAARFPARSLVYLPAASYAEMMEWSLPPDLQHELERIRHEMEAQGRDDVLRHLAGGFWRNFMRKYPEVNSMQKRMLRAHDKVQRARRIGDVRGAQHALWRGQCNCPYWHGVFGGLYLRHIRAATHRNLVAAEREADRLLHGGYPWAGVDVRDWDFDGKDEILVQTDETSLLIHPWLGGALSEWDLRAVDWNLLHTLTRRREAYHEALLRGGLEPEPGGGEAGNIHGPVRVKEGGLAAGLAVDHHRRLGWQDRILPYEADLGTLMATDRDDGDFLNGVYAAEPPEEADGETTIRLRREGTIDTGAGRQPLRIEKSAAVSPERRGLSFEYVFTNTGETPITARFASEWNLNLPQAPEGDDRVREIFVNGRWSALDGPWEGPETDRVELRGSSPTTVSARFDRPVGIWAFPVESVSSSEGGLERVYQGTCLLFLVVLDLAPDASDRLRITWDWSGP